ncbi:MAG: hypothetical protein B7Y07_09240 [Halothiobacillus sp. 24-54-40]|jgi:uncharacterized membrane protein|nr:MAG: hypothetical protein B7Y58_10315 [Halothiobacillus sp. 35-54-62]OYZ86096.1 MAG: hypothetical protein B7Y07_09240 [Halothiobacillus sp. 24-54-40]OZA79055.1 MAG: hypothetical protein B7X64_11300 [Halothiobacillus sp. 39-53-45]HQS03224.1 DUF502 domain-containing protein [Halothiobacillus sp.]HQS29493.1 DUF502 domain-containing protein [Halothiobacillus sp.]
MSDGHSKVSTFRKWLVAGVLVWAPLAITFWVINAIVGFMDQTILFLPPAYRPEALFGFNIPGLGAVLAVFLVLLTGALVANFLGRKLITLGESVLNRIPLVRSVYSAVKQVIETFVSQDSRSFRQVVLVEYPRKDCWSIAFLAGDPVGEVQEKTAQKVITVFVPTAPNPTSGFVIMVPEHEIIPLDMSVEEGFRMVISLGVVTPKNYVSSVKPAQSPLENPSVSG